MADQKLTAITSIAALADADLLYLVSDPGGTPAEKSITLSVLRKYTTGRTKHAARASGSLVLNSTSWANLDTGLDLTLSKVAVGDVVEVGLSALWNSDPVVGLLNVGSLVSAAIQNVWSQDGAEVGTGGGVGAWRGNSGGSLKSIGGSVLKSIVSGDLAGTNLVLRFRFRTVTAANKTLFATGDNQIQVWAKNHGPEE